MALLGAVFLFTLGYIFGQSSVVVPEPEVAADLNQVEGPVAQNSTGEVAGIADDTRDTEEEVQEDVKDERVYSVTRVIDGDTIEVMYHGVPTRVRYIGVDTPETVHPSKPVECFGVEASAKNKALVLGQEIRLERDISDTDRYGRLLRYVYVDDVFVNHVLVAEGYAHARSYPPDVAFSDIFRQAEREAREAGRGLWGTDCEAEKSMAAPATNASAETRTCSIKGNISASGEKIYHVLGCGSYEKTRIDESAGEQWFCTEKEALDAGWRKALNC
jgi:micrococcal nuclease